MHIIWYIINYFSVQTLLWLCIRTFLSQLIRLFCWFCSCSFTFWNLNEEYSYATIIVGRINLTFNKLQIQVTIVEYFFVFQICSSVHNWSVRFRMDLLLCWNFGLCYVLRMRSILDGPNQGRRSNFTTLCCWDCWPFEGRSRTFHCWCFWSRPKVID